MKKLLNKIEKELYSVKAEKVEMNEKFNYLEKAKQQSEQKYNYIVSNLRISS